MKLSDERNYQELLDVLEGLGLSEENQKTADAYFGERGEPDETFLARLRLQDLSGLSEEAKIKSIHYLANLNKRGRTEAFSRYVRFVAALGGSTAGYVMVRGAWIPRDMQECLRPEQEAAIRAEALVWNKFQISRYHMDGLYQIFSCDPEILQKSMRLCCQKYNNAKILLASLYLFAKKKEEKSRGLFQKLLGGRPARDAACVETADFLKRNLTKNIPLVFGGTLKEEEKREIENYINNGNPRGAFPASLLKILEGKQTDDYLLTLFCGSAFLALPYLDSFLAFLQVMAAAKPEDTLSACLLISEDAWFQDQAETLEQTFPASTSFFIHWYVIHRMNGNLQRMIARFPDLVLKEAQDASLTTDNYEYLSEQVRKKDRALYKKLAELSESSYFDRMAEEMTRGLTTGRTEARQYLLGEIPLEKLLPFVNSFRGLGYHCKEMELPEDGDGKAMQLYRRNVVLNALKMQGGFFAARYWPRKGVRGLKTGNLKKNLESLLRLLEEEGVSIQYQADALEGMYSSYYRENDKKQLLDAAVEILSHSLAEHREEFYQALKSSTSIGRAICLRVLDTDWKREEEAIFSCALDSSRQVQGTLVEICGGHVEWEPRIRALLSSGKAQERELAVRVMKEWGADRYREELAAALEKEKSKKVKALLQDCLGADSEEAAEALTGSVTVEKLAADILKGGKKRKVAWAYETPFSPVHKTDGSPAPEEYLQALLTAYADMSVPGVSPEAKRLAQELDVKELGQYVRELFDKWMDTGAEAKKKWVLYAASIHGQEEAVPLFRHQIQEWPQHARGALAAEAVKALALNGSSEALLLVDQISRKFKFRQMKAAAAQALDYAASSLGISRAELEDRIVPDLGFDESMKRTFDYGARSFQVYLTPALELEVFDENEKRLKSMPAPGKKDDPEKAKASYEEFKQVKKQLKTVAANQKLRLEQALSAERLWNADQWKALFVKNPVMHQFAIGLIWGLYEDGALTATFRYMEDGSFNTMDEEEYEFPADGQIGLVHPIELPEEERKVWKEQLADYEVVQPIEQLDRPIFRMDEEERGKAELTRFGGKVLNGLSLSGKLQGMGWYRGSVQDAGVYTTFYREDGAMGVELEFSGSYVADENDEVTVYGALFYQAGTVARGSYVYDTVKKEHQYRLDQVPPRYFSEIVLQLTRATASSQERLNYPECRR